MNSRSSYEYAHFHFHNSILRKFSNDNQRKTSAFLPKRILSKMKCIECSKKSESGSIKEHSVIIYKKNQSDMYFDIVRFFEHTWYFAIIHDNDVILKDIFIYWECIHVYFCVLPKSGYRWLSFSINFFTVQISDILIEVICSTKLSIEI